MSQKLSVDQVAARMQVAQSFLAKRFPGLAFCLIVPQALGDGTSQLHASYNLPKPLLRKMLVEFTTAMKQQEFLQ